MQKAGSEEKFTLHNKMKIAVALFLFLVFVRAIQEGVPMCNCSASPSGIIITPNNISWYNLTPTSTIPVNQSGQMVAVNLSQELNNSRAYTFNVNSSMFNATSASECAMQLIAPCNNNVPAQFVCVNSAYSANIETQRQSIYEGKIYACPAFIEEGNLSCGVQSGYCVVTKS